MLLAFAAPAAAQGYTAREGDDALLPQPPVATPIALDSDTPSARVEIPFRFHCFGEPYTEVGISMHGFVVLGATASLDVEQPAHLPIRGGAVDGAIAPLWQARAGRRTVHTWTNGQAPARRFVIEWSGDDGRVQLQLHERADEITFAYGAGRSTRVAPSAKPRRIVRGLDERGGDRFVVPVNDTTGNEFPTLRTINFQPRAPLFHPDGIGKERVPVRWLDVRQESTVPQGSAKRCTYLAKGRHTFHVPDRALLRATGRGGLRKQPKALRDALRAEDRAAFGGARGDARRWVRQVLDGKMIFLPASSGAASAPPLRVWFRIIEYFSVDDRGNTLTDQHTWNLRWMLSNAFRDKRRKEPIDGYSAWKAMARGRLSVGKLFSARQTDDAGRQFSSGRKNEYLLWSGHVKRGTRGALATAQSPTAPWVEFYLRQEDSQLTQHVKRGDLRFVPDPNYVDGQYEYTIEALDNPYGWVTGGAVPPLPIRDEDFDVDPGRVVAPVTPR